MGRFVRAVRRREGELASAGPAQFDAAVTALRLTLGRDGLGPGGLVEAFAVLSVVCAGVLGVRPYDTQLVAARIVLDNSLAEMATGEGKTLAVALAAATAALAGVPVHVITANDYLVSRDAAALEPLYAALGLRVGAVVQSMGADARRDAYACDVAYCTAKELVFDYLRDGLERTRDRLRWHVQQLCGDGGTAPVLRGLCMAIVDEADSILIDEARVPLILSRPVAQVQQDRYLGQSLALARSLEAERDYRLEPGSRSAVLTPAGADRVARAADVLGAVWHNRLHREEVVGLALTALHLYRRDRDYLVRDGAVQIVDEHTGRVAPGRAWSRGLHQLLELKEGCAPTPPTETLAQITYQRFFPRYLRLGGLSGTLREARAELLALYGLPVRGVPLRGPDRRVTLPSRLFADSAALWSAVAARAASVAGQGRPVLVGTATVADSEALSARLAAAGVDHVVLNARQDGDEARVVAEAGLAGRITVATNMAGRGTDIALAAGCAERGGLHVIVCQLNGARRIDRQLAGRCARQGDPGSVETWLAADMPLLHDALPAALRRGLQRWAPRVPDAALKGLRRLLQGREERLQALQRRRLRARDRYLERGLSFRGVSE
ncbi:MAG TPA: preprotein translocase subunit SecA [Rhodocyclaceae bacterium]|nr:preprotein translocase subunit SecA [Rhodocyclaceae bacterium]